VRRAGQRPHNRRTNGGDRGTLTCTKIVAQLEEQKQRDDVKNAETLEVDVTRLAGLCAVAALYFTIAAAQAAQAATAPCHPAGLRASFRVVAGSAGAGHISYDVRLTNRGTHTCVVSGRPGLRLLDRHGKRLPTTVVPDRPGSGTAALIRLRPGRTAIAEARIGRIAGTGEPQTGPCEPTAYRVRVTLASPGSGSLVGPVSPPTPVCEHGRITEGLLHLAP
jgi:hypothetical protein